MFAVPATWSGGPEVGIAAWWRRFADPTLRVTSTILSEQAKQLGAAWYRLMTADDPGYGFIDSEIPEITIGVVPSRRRRGVGRRLLTALLDAARAEGHDALSLSVEEDNFALRLYESVGFRPVEKVGNAWTMMVPLS